MDIKKKRERLITWILAIGVFLPILLFPWCCPKGQEPFLIMKLICFVAIQITGFLYIFTHSVVLIVSVFTIAHVLTCLFIGWIIARLVYPNRKSLPESTNTSKSN